MTTNDRRDTPGLTTRELVEGLVGIAVADPGRSGRTIERLCTLDPVLVARESERQLVLAVGAMWKGGWQPAELARLTLRTTNAAVARLTLAAIAADHASRPDVRLDRRWSDQIEGLDLPRVQAPSGWLRDWSARQRVEWPDLVAAAVALLRVFALLTRLPILIPPPGSRADAFADIAGRTNDPILNRVRALLAQAESTTFDAEAETFTAKAQALMTRHAIDLAMVSGGVPGSETPLTIRIPIDDPYVEPKSLLLHQVAKSSRCRSVFHPRFAMASVVGFAGDVAATDMLFTSLLVQAQTSMLTAAAAAPAGARSRSRAFRSAFLVAYSHRIGERLAEINAGVVDEAAATSQSILPVLAARSAEVDAAVDELFGDLRASRFRGGYDSAGWASGHLAADRARLGAGDLDAPAPRQRQRAISPTPMSR